LAPAQRWCCALHDRTPRTGLAIAGVWATHRLRELDQKEMAAATDAKRAEAQIERRQKAMSRGIAAVSERTEHELHDLQARRSALSDTSGVPLKKADTAIRMTQLMSDQVMAMMRNLADQEEIVGRGVRPIAEEGKTDGEPAKSPKAPANQGRSAHGAHR